jgi:hypothetical protein
MHRTEGANNLNNLYTDGPPATVITPEAMNSIQEELAFIIESAGLKLLSASNDTKTQVLEALKTIFKIGNPVQTITASSANLQVNTEYLINYTGGVCTLQLPQYFAVGDWIKIRDAGGYGFKIQQASSGNIILPNGSRTPAGSIYFVQSKSKFASLELEGVIANSRWKIVSVMDPGLRMKG